MDQPGRTSRACSSELCVSCSHWQPSGPHAGERTASLLEASAAAAAKEPAESEGRACDAGRGAGGLEAWGEGGGASGVQGEGPGVKAGG